MAIPTPVVEAVEHIPGVARDVLVKDGMLALFQNCEMDFLGCCEEEGRESRFGRRKVSSV